MRTKLFFAIFLAFTSLCANAGINSLANTAICLACNVPDGLTVSDLTGTSATLNWNAVSGATQYTVEVQDEQNNPSTFHIETNVNGTSYAVMGLTAGVSYKFKVRSSCGGDKSDWSDWVSFTSGNSGGGSNTCAIPTTLSATVNGSSAILSWNKVSGATQYYIEVEDEQNVPSNFHVEVSVQDSFYTVVGLQAGVSYKFKVRSHCAGGQSDWSNSLFFNGNTGNGGIGSGSGNCNRPTGSQVMNITASAALLSWNAVPGIASYTLEIEREPSSSWQITQVVMTNSFLLTGLNADTKYKFKVRSNCTGGDHSNWTKWRKFKTAPSFTGNPGNSNLINTTADRSGDVPTELANALEVKVWPNPVQSSVAVRLQNLGAESATLRLFDLAGRLVQVQQIQSETGAWEGELNLNNLPNGVYLLQTQSGASTQTIKLVLSH